MRKPNVSLLAACFCMFLLAPACAAADKEVVQLQRDIALVDDRVRILQGSVEERLGAVIVLLEQALRRVDEVRTADAVMGNTLKERLGQQEKNFGAPVVSLGVKMDRMTSEFLAVSGSVTDLEARLQRLESKIDDMEDAMRVIQSPPPPPSASEALGGPPAGVSAEGLYQAAVRDQLGGNADVALQGFQDYLRYFGNTELAASSQFHIGEIYYGQGDLKSALTAFDLVLERHPKSGAAPGAQYLRARALEGLGRGADATQALKALLRDHPNSEAAKDAQSALNRLQARTATRQSRR